MNLFKETKFYDIGTQNIKTINQVVTGGAVLFISIGNYAQTIQFERTVYSFLDLFGYLGGLYDFMFIVGFLLMNGFQDKIYQNLISSNIYQVKSVKEIDTINNNSSNLSILEETKQYCFQNIMALNRKSTSVRKTTSVRKSNRNMIVPSSKARHEQVYRIGNITDNQTYK